MGYDATSKIFDHTHSLSFASLAPSIRYATFMSYAACARSQ